MCICFFLYTVTLILHCIFVNICVYLMYILCAQGPVDLIQIKVYKYFCSFVCLLSVLIITFIINAYTTVNHYVCVISLL